MSIASNRTNVHRDGCPQCCDPTVCKHNCYQGCLGGSSVKIQLEGKLWYVCHNHKAISLLLGSVMLLATSGVKHPMCLSRKRKRAVCHVLNMHGQSRSIVQPLQRILRCWHNGSTIAMQTRGTFLTASCCKSTSRYPSFATNVQRDSSISLLGPAAAVAAARQAGHSVLGKMLTDATPCRLCTSYSCRVGP